MTLHRSTRFGSNGRYRVAARRCTLRGMEIVLADLAPDPEPSSGAAVVVAVVGGIVVVTGVILLVVWLMRRSRP